jgi:hypothetical protein
MERPPELDQFCWGQHAIAARVECARKTGFSIVATSTCGGAGSRATWVDVFHSPRGWLRGDVTTLEAWE